MNVRLGRKAPVHDPRTLRLSAFLIASALPPPPPSLDLSSAAPTYPMYANDRLGDCTCAAAGHMTEVWTGKEGKLLVPRESDVITLYDKVNGGSDGGAVMLDVLRTWCSDGLSGEKPMAYMQVDHNNLDHVKIAMNLFQGLYVGVSLPNSAQNETTWAQTTDEPGSWGGHAVSALGYDEHGVTFCSWGKLVPCTWEWWTKYVEECWAVLPSEWNTQPGVDMAALQSNLKALAA